MRACWWAGRTGSATGETCCTTFWVKLNQRFHLLRPHEEKYVAQLESALYNAGLRQMVRRTATRVERGGRPGAWRGSEAQRAAASASQRAADGDGTLPPGIRYHATMEGTVERPNNINTCCEGQGTRLFGSLPEYIFSLAAGPEHMQELAPALLVNLYAAASIVFNASVDDDAGGAAAQGAAVAVVKVARRCFNTQVFF